MPVFSLCPTSYHRIETVNVFFYVLAIYLRLCSLSCFSDLSILSDGVKKCTNNPVSSCGNDSLRLLFFVLFDLGYQGCITELYELSTFCTAVIAILFVFQALVMDLFSCENPVRNSVKHKVEISLSSVHLKYLL